MAPLMRYGSVPKNARKNQARPTVANPSLVVNLPVRPSTRQPMRPAATVIAADTVMASATSHSR